MPPRGIPPSLERREFLLRATAAGVALAAAAGAVLYFLALPFAPEAVNGTGPAGPGAPDGFLAERDRAAAYKAVRDHMHERNWGSDIKGVYCRDSAHRVFYGGMTFEGRIDLEPHAGELIPMDYVAEVNGDRVAGWRVETVRLTKPGGYSEGESEGDGPGGAFTGDAGPSAVTPDASIQ